MHRLKAIEDCLISLVQGQMGNTSDVDAKELGEVVDMIKDMEEAKYYHSISKAMEEKEPELYAELLSDYAKTTTKKSYIRIQVK